MPEPVQPQKSNGLSSQLSERVLGYRQEVEKVVRDIGEHPLYEFKRSCSLQNLCEKIEFVKDVQSIATSRIETEKFLVIGADAATKSFLPVANSAEFDEDNLRKLLDKYLSPIPEFEVFQLETSDKSPFVLIVVPKQANRRIIAKATVHEPQPSGKLLLRKGDLWTKGGATGKRIADSADLDEIFEGVIEAETERRTRQRTAHMMEIAIAREKVQQGSGRSTIPTAFSDQEFEALMEELCSSQDKTRFALLMERLRDDLVEGWHRILAYEDSGTYFTITGKPAFGYAERARDHIKNVFRPAMHWLTLSGLFVVKNAAPTNLLEMVVDLLKEVYDSTHSLVMLRSISAYGVSSDSDEQHISHTVPMIESMVSVHIIGSYVAKRERFSYLKTLLGIEAQAEDRYGDKFSPRPLAFWPITTQFGEHIELRTVQGRLNYCLRRIETDSTYIRLFGSISAATIHMCRYEFCLELNSFFSVCRNESPESVTYMQQTYPEIDFRFVPGFIAFHLEYVHSLALRIFSDIKKKKRDFLNLLAFDPVIAAVLTKDDILFARFLKSLVATQAQFYLEMRRFAPVHSWPKDLDDAIRRLPKNDG